MYHYTKFLCVCVCVCLCMCVCVFALCGATIIGLRITISNVIMLMWWGVIEDSEGVVVIVDSVG